MDRYHREYAWREKPAPYRSYSPSYRDRYHPSVSMYPSPRRFRDRSPSPRYRERSPAYSHRSRYRSRSRSRSPRRPVSPLPRTTATASRPPPPSSAVASFPPPTVSTIYSAPIPTPLPSIPLAVSSVPAPLMLPHMPLPLQPVTSVPLSVPTTSPPVELPHPVPTVSDAEDYQSDSSSPPSPSPRTTPPSDTVEDSTPRQPLEDIRTFSVTTARMVKAINLPVKSTPPPAKDCVFQLVQSDAPTPVSIPLLETIRDVVKDCWTKPSTLPPTARRLESLYKVEEHTAPYLFIHPPPGSLVVESSQPKGSTKLHTTPPDKDGRRLDIFGRRFYSSAALTIRVSNFQACMGAYQRSLWDRVLSFIPSLPDDQQQAAMASYHEAVALSNQQIVSSRHVAECASKSMAASVALRRHAWLKSSGISEDTRQRIENLPFDGVGLFGAATDDAIDQVAKAKLNAKRVGCAPPQQKRSNFQRSTWRRQRPSFQGSKSPAPQQRPSFQSRKRPFKQRYTSSSSSKKGGDASRSRL